MGGNILKMKANLNGKIVAFVHARLGSERLPNKNLRILGDKPLLCHAIINALKSKKVQKVVIDSESDKILQIGMEYGAVPLKRSSELATNQATGDDLAFWQANSSPDSEIILQVVPTSPFLLPTSIDRAIDLIYEKNVDSVVGVFSDVFYDWKDGKPNYFMPDGRIPNSFEKVPIIYETTGLYVNRTKFVLTKKKRINIFSCLPNYLSKIESVDINTPEDFEFAETIWQGSQMRKT